MSQDREKKQQEDAMKIMAAVIDARERGETSRLTVEFADNGGVVSITVESKKRYK